MTFGRPPRGGARLAAAVAALLSLGGAGAALAATRSAEPPLVKQTAGQLTVEVVVMLGSNTGKGIDEKLKKKGLSTELSNPPLSAYNTWTMVDSHALSLAKSQATIVKLPTGELSLVLKDPEGKRYQVDLAVKDAKGKNVVSATVKAKAKEKFVTNAGKQQSGEVFVALLFP